MLNAQFPDSHPRGSTFFVVVFPRERLDSSRPPRGNVDFPVNFCEIPEGKSEFPNNFSETLTGNPRFPGYFSGK